MKLSIWLVTALALTLFALNRSAQCQENEIVQLKKEMATFRAEVKGLQDELAQLKADLQLESADETRNPFEVADVRNPYGPDVKNFARTVELSGGADDKNAEQWVKIETEGTPGSLDGAWFGRWEQGNGVAKILADKDRVFVLYTDKEGRLKNRTWLLEAVREGKDRLVGRWVQVGNPRDTGPFVGLIVNDGRIDGTWGGKSRWDFRRKLKK